MWRMKKAHYGFALIESVLAILVLAAVGLGGYKAYQHQHNKNTATLSTPASQANPKAATSPATSYTGWKTYCDSALNTCFRYPAEWESLAPIKIDGQNLKAFGQNKEGTINLEYSEPISGSSGLGNFFTKSLNQLRVPNSAYEVIGGYYTTGNLPGFSVIDTSLAQQHGLVAGQSSDLGNSDLYFTKNLTKGTLTISFNNTGTATIPAAQASAWFDTSDGKTALSIAQSFYAE